MQRIHAVNRRHRKATLAQLRELASGGDWIKYSAKAGYYSADWLRRLRRTQLAAGD